MRAIPAEAGGFALGRDIAVVALPGEVFTQIGMDIRAASPFAMTLFAQNSNSRLGYVPSEKAFADDAHNYTLRPEYDEVNLAEAIGINCSYETSYVSCRLDERAGKLVARRARTVLSRLSAR